MGLDMYLDRANNKGGLAQWRKFNALHNWVCVNVAGREDINRRPVPVSRYHLELLRHQVMQSVSQRKPFLMPVAGFFFGSDEVDDYYWENCVNLIGELTAILTMYDDKEFVYVADW